MIKIVTWNIVKSWSVAIVSQQPNVHFHKRSGGSALAHLAKTCNQHCWDIPIWVKPDINSCKLHCDTANASCNFHCWNTWNSTRLWIIGLFWYVCISCDIQHNQQRHIGSSLMIVESVQPQYLWHQEQNVLPHPHLYIHHVTASKCHCIFHSKTQSRSRYICLSISSPCGNT